MAVYCLNLQCPKNDGSFCCQMLLQAVAGGLLLKLPFTTIFEYLQVKLNEILIISFSPLLKSMSDTINFLYESMERVIPPNEDMFFYAFIIFGIGQRNHAL